MVNGVLDGQEHNSHGWDVEFMTGNGRKTHRKRWTPGEIRYLKKNFSRSSLEDLSQEMKRDLSSIRVAAYALGLVKTKRNVRSRK